MMRLLTLFLLPIFSLKTFAETPSVIIVGAGPAGIAAATKLLQNAITNITIVEAENRIGGRIHSVKFGDGYVDLGAEYCHGEKGNIVYELAKNLDVLEHSNLFNSNTSKIFTSDGSEVKPDLVKELFFAISTYDEGINTTSGVSLGDAFLQKYNSTLQKYSQDHEKLKVTTDAIKMIEEIIVMHEGAFNWQQPAARNHYDACEGDQQMTWKIGGYHTALKILMKSFPNPEDKLPIDDKVLLNKKVKNIVWNDTQINVNFVDNLSLKADHVIFTPSVGVLQSQKNTLFQPQLPSQKLKALEAFGFSGVMKIVLHFPIKWWKDEDSMFFFLWNKEDLDTIDFKEGPTKSGVPWVAYIPAMVKVPSNPNVLILWVCGDLIPEIENISEDVLIKGSSYVLNKFFGKTYNITHADKVLRSQWVTNPNFLGTYSYEKVGYFEEDVSYQKMLSEPLIKSGGKPGVLFAGEATHPTLYSTVHGAISSGIREADRIINLYNEQV